ncbi:hypothetical cytosolic protein [Syntrophus aciditrophicus SB]|uniref:Hypothetical cytosolic protein n=1 Tax=Syntrophus aciditrophicus (strain SB) TaxID=56780 RepID=Q2LUS1_SYNAS|nr:hypothetical cytosolic protein [Syntrophus aciditrophicus SB]
MKRYFNGDFIDRKRLELRHEQKKDMLTGGLPAQGIGDSINESRGGDNETEEYSVDSAWLTDEPDAFGVCREREL